MISAANGSASARPVSRVPIALYPIVLAAALIAELFIISGVSPLATVRTLLLAVVAALAFSSIGRVVFRDRDRGGVAAVLAILLLFGGADTRVAIAIAFGFAILAIASVSTRRSPAIRWWIVGRALTAVAAILALAVGFKAVEAGTLEVLVRAITLEAPFRDGRAETVIAETDLPDIYLILLDGYARRDVFEEVFHADGATFIDGLEGREFAVSDRSRSTYATTPLTLASLFAMRPIQDIETLKPLVAGIERRPAGALLREAINDGQALDVLRSLGYEVHGISSGFEEPALRQADVWIDTGQVNEFEMALLRRSFLSTVLRAVAPDFVSSQYRARIDGVLRAVEAEATASSARPRFIFGHVPSPHAPWVYHADGTPRTALEFDSFYADSPDLTGVSSAFLQAAYVGQATWLSQEVLRTVDRLVADSETPPVIVLFSDHGTWIGAHGTDVRRRFRTLLAARTPDGSTLFPEEVASVDLLPILIEHIAGISQPRHANAPSYMSSQGMYDFYEIPDPNDPPTAGVKARGMAGE